MKNNFDEHRWNSIKSALKTVYPLLTDSDLLWRDGTNKTDMLKDLAVRLKVSWKELETIVDHL